VNVRTTDPTHVKLVQDIGRKLDAAGVIYKGKYEGWYCVGHEQFFPGNEAKEMDYFCSDHQKPLDKISEENYYLRVSKYTDEIREFAKNAVAPSWRGREILELVKDGAQDVSISRPREKLSWGVPVPGDEKQVMYVWVDALSNYITALGFPEKSSDFWSENSRIIEIVGKDIVRFHAIIWPAMLLALGYKLPDVLLTHGFINVGGAKMSKSLENVVSPLEIIENYGADAFRFYFAKHVSTFDDGDFTWEKFENSYNGELANDLGNLVSRSANMLMKYEVSRKVFAGWQTNEMRKNVEEYSENFAEFEINKALENVWNLVRIANQFVDETKPWEVGKLAGSDEKSRENLAKILNNLWIQVSMIGELLVPFLPETSAQIREIFDGQGAKIWADGREKITEKPEILFVKKYLHTTEPSRK
jgi:methionyl-tRNA synthetase